MTVDAEMDALLGVQATQWAWGLRSAWVRTVDSELSCPRAFKPYVCPLLWTTNHYFVYNSEMPRKPPIVFPQEQRLLSQLGERLKLARMRRKLSNAVVAQRAGISRTSLYKVEAGDPGATLGTYMRVMAVLGLEADINALAADDKVGRKLQDLALEAAASAPRRRRAATNEPPTPAVRPDGIGSAS